MSRAIAASGRWLSQPYTACCVSPAQTTPDRLPSSIHVARYLPDHPLHDRKLPLNSLRPLVLFAAARGVPTQYQSTSVAAVTASSYLGTALAFGFSPSIINNFGWEVGVLPSACLPATRNTSS